MSSKSIRPTKKQQAVLDFIADFIAKHGYSPSYREISAGCSFNSVATTAKHVNSLIARGHLQKRPGSARSLEITTLGGVGIASQDQPCKWLCGKLDALLESGKNDDAYVLVGALKVMGCHSEFKEYVKKLK